MHHRFSGSMTAIVTPFSEGEIDIAALERIVEFQIANGTSALVPCGSTGESATLTSPEHAKVVRLVVQMVRGRIPVIAGTGSNATAQAIELTLAAKDAGADAALLISPYYNKPTQEGIHWHYRKIAEATRFPLIAYNIPGRTASKIEAVTIARLAELGYIIGLKDATGSLDEVQEVLRLCGERISVYSGDDALTLPIMAVGGAGVISVVSNIIPKRFSEMVAAMQWGDLPLARIISRELWPLMKALFLETNPIPVKAAMAMMGFCRNEVRLPLLPMTEGPQEKLRTVLEELGILSTGGN